MQDIYDRHDEIIIELFDKFSTIYGRLWESKTSSTTLLALRAEWRSALGGIKPGQVKKAYELIRSGLSEFNKFPPNCLQFAQLARVQKSSSNTEVCIPDERPAGGLWEAELKKRMSSTSLTNHIADAKQQKNPIKYLLGLSTKRTTA